MKMIQKEQSEYLKYVSIPKQTPVAQRYCRGRSLGAVTKHKGPMIFESDSKEHLEPVSPGKTNKSIFNLQDGNETIGIQDQIMDNSPFMITELMQGSPRSPGLKQKHVEFRDSPEPSSPGLRVRPSSPERSVILRPMTADSANKDSPKKNPSLSPDRNFNEFCQSFQKSTTLIKHNENKLPQNEDIIAQQFLNQTFSHIQVLSQAQIQERESRKTVAENGDDEMLRFSRLNLKPQQKKRAGSEERGRSRGLVGAQAAVARVSSQHAKKRERPEVVMVKTIETKEELQKVLNKSPSPENVERSSMTIDKWADVRIHIHGQHNNHHRRKKAAYEPDYKDLAIHPLWRYGFVQKLVQKDKKNKNVKIKDLNQSDIMSKTFHSHYDTKKRETVPITTFNTTKEEGEPWRVIPLEGKNQRQSVYKVIQQKNELAKQHHNKLNESFEDPIQKIENANKTKGKVAGQVKISFDENLMLGPTRNARVLSAYKERRDIPDGSRAKINLEQGRFRSMKKTRLKYKEDEDDFEKSIMGMLKSKTINKDNGGLNKSAMEKMNISNGFDSKEDEKDRNLIKAKLLKNLLKDVHAGPYKIY